MSKKLIKQPKTCEPELIKDISGSEIYNINIKKQNIVQFKKSEIYNNYNMIKI